MCDGVEVVEYMCDCVGCGGGGMCDGVEMVGCVEVWRW